MKKIILFLILIFFILLSCPEPTHDNNGNGNGEELFISPSVISIFPADLEESVSLIPVVSVTFSEEITIPEFESVFFLYKDQDQAMVDGTLSHDGNVLEFIPEQPLQPYTTYTIRIYNWGIEDPEGNVMEADFFSGFTTGPDLVSPEIVSVMPGNGKIDIACDIRIEIEFSETMNTTSVSAAFSITGSSGNIAGNLLWNENTLLFTPSNRLQIGEFTITVSTLARDEYSNAIIQPVSSVFTTGVPVHLAAGYKHTLAAMSGGSVKAWGGNSYSQTGQPDIYTQDTPAFVNGIADSETATAAVAVAAGKYHSAALLADGRIMTWGSNYQGQLGIGTNEGGHDPVFAGGIETAAAVAAGGNNTAALLTDGSVMIWGDNSYGQLGDGTTEGRNIPAEVPGITGAVAIAAGEYHSAAVLSGGTVLTWGRNDHGQLGNGTNSDSTVPVTVSGITTAVSVAVGPFHSSAVLSDGTVMSWGYDWTGQLGDGFNNNSKNVPVHTDLESSLSYDEEYSVISAAAGGDHGLALLDDGRIMAWGSNYYGQIGGGLGADSYPIPILAGNFSSDPAVMISAGSSHSAALLEEGIIMTWGRNDRSQLGADILSYTDDPQIVEGL